MCIVVTSTSPKHDLRSFESVLAAGSADECPYLDYASFNILGANSNIKARGLAGGF
jgi:hypothetical protein